METIIKEECQREVINHDKAVQACPKLIDVDIKQRLRTLKIIKEVEKFDTYNCYLTKNVQYEFKCSQMWKLTKSLLLYESSQSTAVLSESQLLQEEVREHEMHLSLQILDAYSYIEDFPCIQTIKNTISHGFKNELNQMFMTISVIDDGIVYKRFMKLLELISEDAYIEFIRFCYVGLGDRKTFKVYKRWRKEMVAILDDPDYLWIDMVNTFNYERQMLDIYPGSSFAKKMKAMSIDLIQRFTQPSDIEAENRKFVEQFQLEGYAFHIFGKHSSKK